MGEQGSLGPVVNRPQIWHCIRCVKRKVLYVSKGSKLQTHIEKWTFGVLTEDAGINHHVMVSTADDKRAILGYVFFTNNMNLFEEPR